MNDHKTLAALLRERAVYEDANAGDPDPRWKEALLADLDLEASLPGADREPATESADAPLRLRHLGLMAPFGAALFLAGYWLGNEGATAADLASIHPFVWIGVALGVASFSLIRFGRPLLRR